MKNLRPLIFILFCICVSVSKTMQGQDCTAFHATFASFESRCSATGSIKIFATGGSGSYKYRVTGPVNTNFTTTDSVTGLSAGLYTVIVNDIVTNCTYIKSGIAVTGTYEDPRFNLSATDVSCENATNGGIQVDNTENGRSPFEYTIIAPSPMGVGLTNTDGIFNNLSAGNFYIRLTDSCGGIQTRQILINNYTWNIDSCIFRKISCDSAAGYIKVTDSKGNVSTESGVPGFTYGLILQAGDTLWSPSPYFTFRISGNIFFDVVAKDACGNIKKFPSSVSLQASANDEVNIFNKTCNLFSVSLSGMANFFTPGFCLYDSAGVLIRCDSAGVFTDLPYGSYCIKAYDACSDTTITRCFAVSHPVVSVADDASISNKVCSSFSASITGQGNLTNPQYCLYDTADLLLGCNNTGMFDSLSYKNKYCITTKDGCIDTTITRCFSAEPPVALVDSIIPVYNSCSSFGIHIKADSISNATYCLYDSIGNLIRCDSTGIFDSLVLGKYCIHIHDACKDTTIIKCFTAGPPLITNDITFTALNKTCSTFTASASSENIITPYYCLYDKADVLIACDSSGIFNNLPYGSYCIKTKNPCPNTTYAICFTQRAPVPSVSATVKINNNTCTTFTAKITGQLNLTNPQYCIYDPQNNLLGCNTTGTFDHLLYGNYCIRIINTCYDTAIVRCFTAALMPVHIAASAVRSCVYGFSKFNVTISGGGLPFHIKVYNPAGDLFLDSVYNTNIFYMDTIPGVNPGESFKITVADNCGSKDSLSVKPVVSYFNHSPFIIKKCPGGTWSNGSGDIEAIASTNMGALSVRIIKKDSVVLASPLVPVNFDSSYKFSDLGPGNYIVSYKASDACNKYLYDTVTIERYLFPNLNRSTAYKCDVHGFSVSAITTNGIEPFTYEIIGSNPSAPSIITGPQTDALFNIDNGTNYSLIRLRALDACGNATLGDESILPLASDHIVSSANCFLVPTTLSVDSIYNSTYEWYKKEKITDTDSTFLGSQSSYYIATVLPADTGIYICHIAANSGCVTRTYLYDLNASCYTVLPVTLLNFNGTCFNDKILLSWQTINEHEVKTYVIERKNDYNVFEEIGKQEAEVSPAYHEQYNFTDNAPSADKNLYRLKVINKDNSFAYSNIITVTAKRKNDMVIYPNPVTDVININFNNLNNHSYEILLYNEVNQLMEKTSFVNGINSRFQIARNKSMNRGIYILKIIDEDNNEQYSQKIIFR